MKRRWFPWLWWWDIGGWPVWNRLGLDPVWSVNERGVAAWPGMIRCLFFRHADDGYYACCYCGKWLKL